MHFIILFTFYYFFLLDINGLPEIEIIQEIVHEEALLYIAGYVVYRFRSKYPTLGVPTREMPCIIDTPHWMCHISRGSLIYPSDKMVQAGKFLERIFNCFHKDSLSDTNMIFQKVAALVKQKIDNSFTIPNEVLLCLVRTRTYIRLKELNKKRRDSYDKIRIAARSAKTQKFYR
ncbi:hypothetical protein TSAR_011643 [Trichomalopsis sarcophagae]|uniref:Uncharacterized protein n=1 Tax=Trichomalopsis sarcophagae TaxID=543379 RepID=A0A232EIJ6_9HYME|nr:hypothetical protein TSAR_011643 [Trichomalopsis sarcophagae]